MNHLRTRIRSGLALALLATPVLGSETTLFPPVSAPDADAYGKLEVEKQGNEQEFKVRGFKLATTAPPGPFEVWIESGVGTDTYALVGASSLKSSIWELKLEENGGAPGELGVADLADLTGRRVQVRDAGGANVYLVGVVPAPSAGNCNQPGPAKKAKRDLQRPVPAVDPNASGEVEVARKGGEQEFEVEAKNLDPAGAYTVHVETGVGTGAFVFVSGMQLVSATLGKFKIELEAECAAPPVAGIADVDDLADRRVQVRDALDQVLLVGVIPALPAGGAGQANFNVTAKLQGSGPSPGAKGYVRLKFIAPQGTSRLEVNASKLAPGAAFYQVQLEDGVGSGVFEPVGNLKLKSNGTAGTLKLDTKKGDSLPFGAATVGAYAGRRARIVDGAATVHAETTIP